MGLLKKVFTRSSNTNGNTNNVPMSKDPFFDFINNVFSNDDFNANGSDVINISNGVFSVVTKIANAISNLPITSTNQYLQNLINNNPNPLQNGRELESSILLNMLIYGDAFCLLTTDKKTGLISRIDLLPTAEVTIDINNNGINYNYAPTGQTFSGKQLLKFSLPSTDGISGISPIIALKNILTLSRASSNTLHQLYKNGIFSKAIINVNDNISSSEKAKIKDQFKKNLGSDNFGGSIIQDSDYIKSITPFNTSTANSSFIKDTTTINDHIKRAICSAYNVPLSLLTINSHSSESDEMSRFHSDIRCYENIIISELNSKLSGSWSIGNYIDINTPTDVSNLAKSGAISPAQAQTLLGLPIDDQFNNKTNNKVKNS